LKRDRNCPGYPVYQNTGMMPTMPTPPMMQPVMTPMVPSYQAPVYNQAPTYNQGYTNQVETENVDYRILQREINSLENRIVKLETIIGGLNNQSYNGLNNQTYTNGNYNVI
jgi:hypothetical protein